MRGGGGLAKLVVFSAIPHLELGKHPFLDIERKNRPPLMLLMLAWACRLILLMLVVSWPRCACVSSILALGVLQHVCLSMFGDKWYVGSTPASPGAVFVWQGVNMLDQNCSY